MDSRSFYILVAEDNPGHRRLTEYALKKSRIPVRSFFVDDGQEVLDYLNRRGVYSDADTFPMPDLILMDLNLPKRDGREVLRTIKNDSKLSHLPVVIVSTSDREEDVRFAFATGAAAYISKSKGFDTYNEEISNVAQYALRS